MPSNTKITKKRRAMRKANAAKARKRRMKKPGTYKLLPLKEENAA